MWTFRVAVALGGIGVDANLRILQGLWCGIPCEASARSREADLDQKFLEWLIEEIGVVEEMIRRKAPVPPVVVPPGDGEAVPVTPILLRVEVPFAAPVPPPPPVLIAEEPVMQVEKFLRLQPPTYSGGPNPDTAEHWVHKIERVFATMRCPAADRVVLAAYQLRGFALEWWRLKMQTTFAGRTREAIAWSEFLDARARRTFHDRRPVQSRAVAVQGRYLQMCSSSSSSVV
ncbi:hypothetical protein Taro_053409 [Colocasia esculenta]|uniref:Retrotransposon gag domain-containing protein n=1 Tax=Colocasia esculenta TaxID=4460 RepID=A0A843XMJ8_COLES|nr:hypothetical protein [Colocasia esculenta]